MGISRELFRSETVAVGIFRCPTHHRAFTDECDIGDAHHFVFPRTSVLIEQAGSDPVVADPNVAILYNRSQRYVRRRLSEGGDRCDWFAVRPDAALDAHLRCEAPVARQSARPFARTHAPVPAALYLHQRRLLQYVRAGAADPLLVEVNVMHLLEILLSRRGPDAADDAGAGRRRRARSREVAEAARRHLARHYRGRVTLAALAGRVGCTEFHLARLFRRHAGVTLHGYLNQLRLRCALERLAGGSENLTAVALELGFSSHSHFTSVFHRSFGTTPSAFRGSPTRRRIAELRKFLIAG